MSDRKFILAIDQGTSSTKSLIFDENGKAIAKGSEKLATSYLDNGFVEQDPEDIYRNVLTSVRQCLDEFKKNGYRINDIAAIGISNQRETFVTWDKQGKPLYNAVVWQCKRSVGICEQLKNQGLSETIHRKTGLVIDPYFSATKLMWLFQNNPIIKNAIQRGNCFFGTIDTWLLYRFTGGREYATDYTNASRTLFFNLYSLSWDNELIEIFGLTGLHLPQVKSSCSLFGETTVDGIFETPVPITAMIGDSHSASFGEGCFESGTAKATLGTGCSILMNVGDKPVQSMNGMMSTICWSTHERIDYALEGVIVSCGSTINWLRDELNLFSSGEETALMAEEIRDNGGVYLLPAFSGLGSPYWQMEKKAVISGLSFNSTKKHIVRAALESIPYQVKDVVTAMEKDARISLKELMVDGGVSSNHFILQFLADLLNKKVICTEMPDLSALGAAYLAGLEAGVYQGIDHLKKQNHHNKIYEPGEKAGAAMQGYEGWQEEMQRFLSQ